MTARSGWLLLVQQMPAKPAYLRVKAWRRLQAMGAVALKGSVYALPASDQTLEDFQWLMQEIVADGGEAMLCKAELVDGLSESEARALFTAPREADYRALTEEVAAAEAALAEEGDGAEIEPRGLARFRKRLEQITAIDFFAAPGRAEAEAAIAALEARLQPKPERKHGGVERLLGRTWVTRRGVQVDRIACAWLIRRFIDPRARFRFVAPEGYRPVDGELRFDMFEAEFTHEGEDCSFEVLVRRTGLSDPALAAIGEIVHDIDLKDDKFGREETAGVAHLLQGIAGPGRDDETRIARGSAMLDDLYDFFTAGPAKR